MSEARTLSIVQNDTKQCTTCKEIKSLELFYLVKVGFDKRRPSCKKCFNEQSNRIEKARRKVDEEYRQRLIDSQKIYRSNESFKISSRVRSLLKKYNLTLEDYNNLFLLQKGSCAICKTHQSELNKRLFVDHCHKTSKVRGLLCSKCNHAIGLLNENRQIIVSAAEYVRRYET